ncbi:hypothetical protein IQ227_25280 [Anabaena aphanizomenioides LEGE 00250]|uniref:XRE family transcriptional regulator n=1 Tax=Sphaerospermopsis aphanizomenoides LEGE 00250 TaxID=2777972 RepID=A0ABR9VL62_9CYAN|nr:hypothetical protein [Sphaerospermopsis aphanizomenoides]MBE9239231.1 hypothetical protein [Sphaerospermopsis aphanizomenoides LEGE 00250]
MEKSKQERLEAKGWKVGTVAEFLELTPKEAALVEVKLAVIRSPEVLNVKKSVIKIAQNILKFEQAISKY